MVIFLSILLFLTNLSFNIRPIYNNDYYWHISVGKWILENKKIPIEDIFSWWGKSHHLPFISHEWLSDIFMYIIGNIGILLILILITSFLFYFLCKKLNFSKRMNFSNTFKFLYLFLGIKILVSIEVRPLMFSLLFFSIFLILLEKYLNNDKKKYFFFLLILQLLWVNMHGGSSSLIPLILGILCIYGFLEKIFSSNKKHLIYSKLKKILLLLVFIIIISFINPYSYKILLYPFLNMMDSTMINSIREWGSIDFHGILGIYYFSLLFLPFLSILLSKKRVSFLDLIFLFGFLFMSLRSLRFIQFYIIIGSIIIGKYMNFEIPIKREIKVNSYVIGGFLLIGLFFVSVFSIKNNISHLFQPNSYSNQAISKIIEYQPMRMFNDYDNEGYLTYRLYYEKSDIFINSIFDIYSKNIYLDYDKITHGIDFSYYLEKYDFDLIIVPPNHMVSFFMKNQNNYSIYYKDKTAIIYVKEVVN
ncbi:MAG: hypothetical protein IKE70_03785 [Bacilli bacterium]|nr:hypothetical protein [Bacilli bacterium]